MSTAYKSFSFALLLALSIFLGLLVPLGVGAGSEPVNVWWPKSGAHLSGSQPFKAQVPGLEVSQYEMFWSVDGGSWVWMDANTNDYPHKEAQVDISSWNWKGAGPYKINFIARQNGNIISEQAVELYIDNGQPIIVTNIPQDTAPSPTPVQQEVEKVATAVTLSLSQPLVIPSTNLYVDPNTPAAKQAASWSGNNELGAQAMRTLAAQPTAKWFGGWNSDIYGDVRKAAEAAQAKNATLVAVAYNIPARDCGGYSAGGSNSPFGYQAWISSFASAIGNASAIVILEPDALSQLSCLSVADQATRLSLLSSAVSALKANPNTKVYIDAGHSGWIQPEVMATSLSKANINQADGFALNVSNFDTTNDSTNYGQQISSHINGKHFVVDTSRSGKGSNGEWCNPSGRAIGAKPTLQTGNSLVDAFLWIKTPGESDGTCNGGPHAGVWWPEYAQSLVSNAQ